MSDSLDLTQDQKLRADRPHRASARSVEFRPIEVVVQDGNVNRAMSMLKRKMATEGIYKELRKRRFFEKPSEEKKRRGRSRRGERIPRTEPRRRRRRPRAAGTPAAAQ